MKDLDEALELDDKLDDVYYYRGLAYLGQEEGQTAVNEFDQAIRLDPYSFDISLELGRRLEAPPLAAPHAVVAGL